MDRPGPLHRPRFRVAARGNRRHRSRGAVGDGGPASAVYPSGGQASGGGALHHLALVGRRHPDRCGGCAKLHLMIQANDFIAGVPCSFLTPLINGVLNDRSLRYVGAASEGEAVAIAAGAWLAGRKTVVMCQNSGLGNAVNPLTSLNAPFRIPTLFVTTWRGQPGIPDEPQHEVMGVITPELLTLMGLEHSLFPDSLDSLVPSLDQASARMEATSLPFAMIMQKDSVAEQSLDPQAPLLRLPGQRRDFASEGEMPARAAVLEAFLSIVDPAAAVVATTGKCGRELFTLDDRRQHIYQVGSMGGASAMALGVALNTKKPVVVLDG